MLKMGKEYGDMTRLSYSKVIASTSTQKPKSGFMKAKGFTQLPPQPSHKGKEKVELPRPTKRSNKVEKNTFTSLKDKAPMRQGRDCDRSMQSQSRSYAQVVGSKPQANQPYSSRGA